jgi:hypothetical protein
MWRLYTLQCVNVVLLRDGCQSDLCCPDINLLDYCKVLLDYCIWIVIVVHSSLIIVLLLKLLYLILSLIFFALSWEIAPPLNPLWAGLGGGGCVRSPQVNPSLVLLTKSSAVPKLSKVNDLTRETWTPISRWMPEHSMHVKTPKFVDNHVGSKGKNTIYPLYGCCKFKFPGSGEC